MVKTLHKKLSELPAVRRERILAEADRLHAEYVTLQELRKAMKLTQEQLAELLKIRQATIAQTEKRRDLMLSTLRSYVEAMGGKLCLTVEFPDREPVSLVGFGDFSEMEEPTRKRAGKRSATA
ncbi:MAG: helix-turn-helix transcriptional regulator [Gammaproteobacteria bacterium]|nr:helix-turn-helix transcriptional regulator [Gammaproteobacteria bacterium]MYC60334.1 helix-turn-helix transcriptional regulator [Gammaproteobacteria bacterium]MYH45376.1 helix-turn-helix transcriptional regulator [Gammaproteobacteria bacterium]MYL14179.1 helix-turn-helix transcriptional regulator [Gammaproteobacteria bacterium]